MAAPYQPHTTDFFSKFSSDPPEARIVDWFRPATKSKKIIANRLAAKAARKQRRENRGK